MAFGRAASAEPLSRDFGFSRGTPVDRFYIESFLADHAADICGRVLEVGENRYSRRFGDNRISKQDILHLRRNEPGATISGDLSDPATLPPRTFDCIVLTQTLHLIFDLPGAVETLHRSLRPGGVLLVTVPGITPIDSGEWKTGWYWSLTEAALSRLLCAKFSVDEVTTETHGNLFAATAFLHGASVEETGTRRLQSLDPSYPVIVAARARATSD
jgi:SAM-dependent methyltransferase